MYSQLAFLSILSFIQFTSKYLWWTSLWFTQLQQKFQIFFGFHNNSVKCRFLVWNQVYSLEILTFKVFKCLANHIVWWWFKSILLLITLIIYTLLKLLFILAYQWHNKKEIVSYNIPNWYLQQFSDCGGLTRNGTSRIWSLCGGHQ